MLDTVTVVDLVDILEDGDRGHELDHKQSPHGDSASSITPSEERGRRHGRDNCDLRDISVAEMHAAGLKTGTKSESAWNRNNTMRGTLIIMAHTMTNLTDSTPLKEGIIQKESKLSPAP
jgi:hypothetical protein